MDELDRKTKEIKNQIMKSEQQRLSEKPTAIYGAHARTGKAATANDFDETLRVLGIFASQMGEVTF